MERTKQVGVVSLPDVPMPSSSLHFDTNTDDVLVIANGCVIGGARLVGPSMERRLVDCWGASDLVADHWWPFAAPGVRFVELVTSGVSSGLRQALERSAAAWGKEVQETMQQATSAIRTAALEEGRRRGVAEVVDRLLDRVEKGGAQALVDQIGRKPR